MLPLPKWNKDWCVYYFHGRTGSVASWTRSLTFPSWDRNLQSAPSISKRARPLLCSEACYRFLNHLVWDKPSAARPGPSRNTAAPSGPNSETASSCSENLLKLRTPARQQRGQELPSRVFWGGGAWFEEWGVDASGHKNDVIDLVERYFLKSCNSRKKFGKCSGPKQHIFLIQRTFLGC